MTFPQYCQQLMSFETGRVLNLGSASAMRYTRGQKLIKKNIPRGGNFSFGIILTKFWKQRIFWGHILAKETDSICIPPLRLL